MSFGLKCTQGESRKPLPAIGDPTYPDPFLTDKARHAPCDWLKVPPPDPTLLVHLCRLQLADDIFLPSHHHKRMMIMKVLWRRHRRMLRAMYIPPRPRPKRRLFTSRGSEQNPAPCHGRRTEADEAIGYIAERTALFGGDRQD